MIKRKLCCVEGCKNLAGLNGTNASGVKRYKKKCVTHHRKSSRGSKMRKKIKNSVCVACGWDKAYCDRHRINNLLGYKQENIRILCPNCHRLVTLGLITVV